jgi:hypothetical protein
VALSTTDFGEFLASFGVFCAFWLQLDRLVTGEGFVCFHELIKTSQLFGSDLSFAGTLPIAIFSSKVEAYSEGIIVDGYIHKLSIKSPLDGCISIRKSPLDGFIYILKSPLCGDDVDEIY